MNSMENVHNDVRVKGLKTKRETNLPIHIQHISIYLLIIQY